MPPHQPSATSRYYAGIGSRKTPFDRKGLIAEIAQKLESRGYTLRSGGAPGADSYFEEACTRSQIFLPWVGFNGSSKTEFPSPTDDAIAMAHEVIDGYTNRTPRGRLLLARNMHQVLGPNLDEPVEFVVCWTPGGTTMGGTAHAIRLARHYKIPVYNLGRPSSRDDLLNRIGLSKQLDLF